MSRHKSTSYVPLLQILLAWVAALALAAGHHAFCASLNTIPSTFTFDWNSQAGASAISTAFAHLVSATLGVSAGTAFLQCAVIFTQQSGCIHFSGLLAECVGDRHRFCAGVNVSAHHNLCTGYAERGDRHPLLHDVTSLWVLFLCASMESEHSRPELNSVSKMYLRPVLASVASGGCHDPRWPAGPSSVSLWELLLPGFGCHSLQSVQFDPPPYGAVNLDIEPSINAYTGWDF
ncbi:hypothetical protein C8R45DRAFT_1108451 [Mycena sanguinolenta]|nr:hypothetical protein C8R45DRAFT_1108451 [Mycena sanguinolenta]